MTFFKTLFFGFFVVILSACKQLSLEDATTKVQSTSSALPASAYLAMAKNQVGEERENLLLLAASRYLQASQNQEAADILTQINPQSPIQNQQKNILLAKLELAQGKPKLALAKLAAINNVALLTEQAKADYHETLAAIYVSRGALTQAVHERIQLDTILQDKEKLTENRRLLWLHLTKLPEAEISTLSLEAQQGTVLKGWMELALLAKHEPSDQNQLIDQLEAWLQHYPNHPAQILLPASLERMRNNIHQPPHQIALLLPLSGALSGPGSAIKDGFMAAFEASKPAQTEVRVYDTASSDVVALYQKAIEEGADYVIGPLTKSDAIKVSALNHPIPTLLLNDMNVDMGQNAYKFGLSITNEARQVALKAHQKGLRNALIIAPEGDWGTEIVSAFTHQWEQVGGTVVDNLRFANNSDLTPAVRDFLHVSEQEAQEKQVRKNPGEPIALAEKRRNDFDMIFLLAYPSKARQIMPLLKYYFASNIPVYSTSIVYTGNTNTMRDRDLDGIIFCDIPSIFENQIANKNWPEQLNNYSRLYTIGMDSYALTRQFNQLHLFPAMGIHNNTSVVYLNQAKRIGRMLAWGKFKGGVAEKIEELS